MRLLTSGFATLIAVVLATTACRRDVPPTPVSATPAAADAQVSPTPRGEAEPESANCPDTDFASFLKHFQASADAQRASTAKVVTMDSIDGNAQPEPAPVTKQVPRSDIKFPIMLGPEQRKMEGLEETVTELGPVEREVKHAVPDSGVQTRFNFQATPCWTLVRISDDTV